jgi:hypothetical protein
MLRIVACPAPSQAGAKTKHRNVGPRRLLAFITALCVVIEITGMTARAGVVLPTNNIEITDAGAKAFSNASPHITAHNGVLYAVWRDGRRPGTDLLDSDVFFASSSDGGAT